MPATAQPLDPLHPLHPLDPLDPQDRLIVALDFPTAAAALLLVDRLDQTCRWFKVGMELYYATGNFFVEELRQRGYNVFLDLKLHDIPNTVAGAVGSAAQAGASLLTLHASGGAAMMLSAAAAAALLPTPPKLLAVTVLTSMDEAALASVGVAGGPESQVLRLARLAITAGIPGLVCSPLEIAALRHEFGAAPLLVVPGIRPTGTDLADQRRVATPSQAVIAGASMLVVGRPITQTLDPAAAARAILDEMAQAQPSSQAAI